MQNFDKMLPGGNFERRFEILNALKICFNVKTNSTKFYGTSQTICKGLRLSKTKDFRKDNSEQVTPVLQSSREI